VICSKCEKDKEIQVVLEIFDNKAKNWKTFHFCGRGCLAKFIIEDTESV
jgi:hypothetical protein